MDGEDAITVARQLRDELTTLVEAGRVDTARAAAADPFWKTLVRSKAAPGKRNDVEFHNGLLQAHVSQVPGLLTEEQAEAAEALAGLNVGATGLRGTFGVATLQLHHGADRV